MDKIQKIGLITSSDVDNQNKKRVSLKSKEINFDNKIKDLTPQDIKNSNIDFSLSELNNVEDEINNLNNDISTTALISGKSDKRSVADILVKIDQLEGELKSILKEKEDSTNLTRNIQFAKSSLALYTNLGDLEKIMESKLNIQELEAKKQRAGKLDKLINELQKKINEEKKELKNKQLNILKPDGEADNTNSLFKNLKSDNIKMVMTAIHNETITNIKNPETGKEMSMSEVVQAYTNFVKDNKSSLNNINKEFENKYGIKISDLAEEDLRNIGISEKTGIKLGNIIVTKPKTDDLHNAPFKVYDLEDSLDARLKSKVITLQPVSTDTTDKETVYITTGFEESLTKNEKTKKTSLILKYEDDLADKKTHLKLLPDTSKIQEDVTLDADKKPKMIRYNSTVTSFEYYYNFLK